MGTPSVRLKAGIARREGALRWLQHAPALLGVALLLVAVLVVRREFRHLRVADVAHAVEAMPAGKLLAAAALTLLTYGVLTCYDRLATIYAGHRVAWWRTALASFCAYALSHNIGFTALSGAAVRYRLYAHWGLSALQIGKVVAFCNLTFALGGFALGGVILVVEPRMVPFFGAHLPRAVLMLVGVGFWALVLCYVLLSRLVGAVRVFGHAVVLPGWRMAALQVAVAIADVLATAAIGYVLLPSSPGLGYVGFVAIYITSYAAGLITNLPGGIGVFDAAMLLGLSPYLPTPEILGAVLLFRLYYYIAPLFLAGFLFAGNEAALRGRALLRRPVGPPQADLPAGDRAGVQAGGLSLRLHEPELAIASASGAVVLCGAMLLSLGALTQSPSFAWIDAGLPGGASQYLPSLIGAALMVLAIGLAHRVTLAWGATLSLLLVAAGFTAADGVPLWLPGLLLLTALLLAPLREAFYRPAHVLSEPLDLSTLLPLFALLLCVAALAAFAPHLRGLSGNAWWSLVISPFVPSTLRLTLALLVGLGLIAIWRLIRPGRVGWLAWSGEGEARYRTLGATGIADGPVDGIVLGEAGRSGIAFRRIGRVLLGLGDPAGPEPDRASAIWRLRDLAVQEGLAPAVWRAGPDLLRVWGGIGLTAVPLGADFLPADAPDTKAALYLCCRVERDLDALVPALRRMARPTPSLRPTATR